MSLGNDRGRLNDYHRENRALTFVPSVRSYVSFSAGCHRRRQVLKRDYEGVLQGSLDYAVQEVSTIDHLDIEFTNRSQFVFFAQPTEYFERSN
jgi:hypothetical protein